MISFALLFIGKKIGWKIIEVLLVSGTKILFAAPLAVEFGFNYIETIILVFIGGMIGVVFFYFLNGYIIIAYYWLKYRVKKKLKLSNYEIYHLEHGSFVKKNKKVFTYRNKFFVRIKRKIGFIGIVIITPFISIPISTFLVKKYFLRQRNIFMYYSVSIFFWTIVFTTIYYFQLKHLI